MLFKAQEMLVFGSWKETNWLLGHLHDQVEETLFEGVRCEGGVVVELQLGVVLPVLEFACHECVEVLNVEVLDDSFTVLFDLKVRHGYEDLEEVALLLVFPHKLTDGARDGSEDFPLLRGFQVPENTLQSRVG